jgi:hypothetical protein
MQVNIIEELIKELEQVPGISHQVHQTATATLRQGIREQLNIFKKTLLNAVSVDMEVKKSENLSTALSDVFMRLYPAHIPQVPAFSTLVHYHKNLLLENSVLFDECLQSSMDRGNVHDVMQLMRLRLSTKG